MNERKTAYTAVLLEQGGFGVAIIEQDVAGYSLDPLEPHFPEWDTARRRSEEKNSVQGLDPKAAWDVVSSSMTASSKLRKNWGPRGA
jgi:hypothetical protein